MKRRFYAFSLALPMGLTSALTIGACRSSGSTEDARVAYAVQGDTQGSEVCVHQIRQGGSGTVSDAQILARTPPKTYGSSMVFSTGVLPKDGLERQTLLQFDMSAIPPGASVTRARLSLAQGPAGGAGTVSIHRITAPWSEATVTWQSFNAAFDPAVAATFPAGTPLVNVDISTLVGEWVQGTHPNYGLLMESQGGPVGNFWSSESTNPNLRPQLDVCYCQPGDHLVGSECVSGDHAAAALVLADTGGVVRVEDRQSPLYGVSITIPPGALQQNTVITIDHEPNPPAMPADLVPLGAFANFGPDGLDFTRPLPALPGPDGTPTEEQLAMLNAAIAPVVIEFPNVPPSSGLLAPMLVSHGDDGTGTIAWTGSDGQELLVDAQTGAWTMRAAITHFSPHGPAGAPPAPPAAPKVPGVCGPDVTAAVDKTLKHLSDDFKTWTGWSRYMACGSLNLTSNFGVIVYGSDCSVWNTWDIVTLFQMEQPTQSLGCSVENGKGGIPSCENSVSYNGTCVSPNYLNYMVFGAMNRLCRDAGYSPALHNLHNAQSSGFCNKKYFHKNEQGAWDVMATIKTGWNNPTGGGSIAFEYDVDSTVGHCAVDSSNAAASNIMRWHWCSHADPGEPFDLGPAIRRCDGDDLYVCTDTGIAIPKVCDFGCDPVNLQCNPCVGACDCNADDDCNDGDPCTQDVCNVHSCEHNPIAGCSFACQVTPNGTPCTENGVAGTCQQGGCCTGCWSLVQNVCVSGADKFDCGSQGQICTPCTSGWCENQQCVAKHCNANGAYCTDNLCISSGSWEMCDLWPNATCCENSSGCWCE